MTDSRVAHPVENEKGEPDGWLILCPGCDEAHQLDRRWTFTGSLERPTFRASLLVESWRGDPSNQTRCHSFITDGQIQFLPDCTHALAGKTVPLEPW